MRQSVVRRAYDDFNEWLALRAKSSAAAGGGSFARGWAEDQASGIHANTPTIVVSETVTPLSTGNFRIIITGSAEGVGDGGPDQFLVSISNGVTATPPIYQTGTPFTSHDNSEWATIALVVDLDMIGIPITYPVGTPVQFNAVIEYSGSNDPATARLQISIQEV